MGGLVFVPFAFVALVIWGGALVMLIDDGRRKRIRSLWLSLTLSPLFSVIGIGWVVWSWRDNAHMGYLQSSLDAVLYSISLPGVIGFLLLLFCKYPIFNILCYSILASVVLTGLLLIVFPQLNDPLWYYPDTVVLLD